jgi:hypothetical protein
MAPIQRELANFRGFVRRNEGASEVSRRESVNKVIRCRQTGISEARAWVGREVWREFAEAFVRPQ